MGNRSFLNLAMIGLTLIFCVRSYGVMVGFRHFPDANIIPFLLTESPLLFAAANHFGRPFIRQGNARAWISGIWIVGLAWLHSEMLQPPAVTFGWVVVLPVLLVLTGLLYRVLRTSGDEVPDSLPDDADDEAGGACRSDGADVVLQAARAGEGLPAGVSIRDETSSDIGAIGDVTRAAFASLEISRHTEQFIVEALRAAGALSVSLVAERNGEVVGHVAFSPVAVSDGSPGWFGLGPVSVLPACQRQGIGSALIREGLSRLKAMNARGCCLVGHPGYYGRFGFRNPDGLVVEGVPPEVFFALAFDGRYPQGVVTFHEAFMADGPGAG